MDKRKISSENKKSLVQYGIIAVIAAALYFTGLHTEVIAFVQRGLLSTGILNPNVEKIIESRSKETADGTLSTSTKANLDFTLIDKDGNEISLEEMRGKVIFMNLWATWCAPCLAEMPSIKKLHKEMGDEVAFVIISLDDDFEKAKAFNKQKGYNLPIYALENTMPAMYDSSTIPTTYIIDAKGNLVLTHNGMADYNSEKFKMFLRSLK